MHKKIYIYLPGKEIYLFILKKKNLGSKRKSAVLTFYTNSTKL